VQDFTALGLSPEQIQILLIDLRNLEKVVGHLKSPQKKNECQKMIKLLDYSLNQALPKEPLLLSAAPEKLFPSQSIKLDLPESFDDYFDKEQDKVTVPVKDKVEDEVEVKVEDSKWKFLDKRRANQISS
jgi:hypothetical protein